MAITAAPPASAATALRDVADAWVVLPGDDAYDEVRRGFNLATDHHPAAVAYPRTAVAVSALVRDAARHGLRVVVWSTGHTTGPLGDLRDALVLRMDRLRDVHVDPARRRVRAGAGARWGEVVPAAAAHGLTVLHGSSPTVGVTGYSLGGGIGWYARHLGLAAHRVTAAQVVLADGTVVRASGAEHPDLMWGLRGAGANLGIVTELEFEAFGFDTAYAGLLAWDVAQAEKVVPAWAEWAAGAPREVTTALRIIALPPFPRIREDFRGRRMVMIDGAVLGDDAAAQAVLAPLRALHPETDTFGRVPTSALTRLHMDPEEPVPIVRDAVLLDRLPGEAVDAFLATAGRGRASGLLNAEIRQLGGALAEPRPEHAALSHVPGRFVVVAVGLAHDDTAAAAAERDTHRVIAAMAPWANGRAQPNFAERTFDTATAFTPQAWDRLRRLRATYDPRGVLRAAHPVPGPGEDVS